MADEDALKAAVEAEGDTIDTSTLPEGLRPEAPAPAPEMESVTINGVEVSLTREQADAYRTQQEAYEREIHEARQSRQPAPEIPQQPENEWDDLWFTDPAKAVEKIEERVTQKITQSYNQQRAVEQWWNDFDRENPNLADKRWLTQAVLNEEMSTIGPLSPAAGRRKLAELTKARIMGLAPPTTQENNETTTLEGASPGGGAQVVDIGAGRTHSLSEAIKAKAAQRVRTKGE